MIKKTITFDDFDGNPVTEDFYFNLNKAEIAEMELSEKGGLGEYLKRITKEEDGKKLIALFKELLSKSVGTRSEDGRQFIKKQETIDYFTQSNAYSELFVELATNAEKAVEFVNGIIPAGLQEEIAKAETNDKTTETPGWITEGRVPTAAELKNATPEQIQIAFERKLAVQQAAVSSPVA